MKRPFVMFLLLSIVLPLAAMPEMTAAAPLSSDLVISQVYGGGGNSGATYTHDFVELFNRGTTTVSVAGWSVQYASSTGSTWGVTALSGSIAPGHYYLVQEAQGAGGTTALPTPDATGSSLMSSSNGKVALVNSATALTGATPAGYVDLVGYGTANWYEGSGAAPGLSNTTAALRAGNGCTDTDVNSSDFATSAPSPRNSATVAYVCSTPGDLIINEFVANHTGTDTNEYVEVYGGATTSYATFTVLEVDGDSGATGRINNVFNVGTTNIDGIWVTSYQNNLIQNGSMTLLLVEAFTGTVSSDLDATDDGVLDAPAPWTRIVDVIAVNDGGATDLTYGTPVLGVAFDGAAFSPGGASRIPNGTDTNAVGDWKRNAFNGVGMDTFTGAVAATEALNTPGAPNRTGAAQVGDLVINEIDYDQPSTDGGEFIELKNTSPVALELSQFSVKLINGNAGGATVYLTITLPSTTLAVADYYVICGDMANVSNCDLDATPDTNLIQNGAPDAAALYLGATLADSVSYEGNTGAPFTEGSGTGLIDDGATAGQGISRCPDGADTGTNNVDFASAAISPGATNTCGTPPPPFGACGDAATLIHDIQGSGAASPLVGQTDVVIEGMVVGDLEASANGIRGFYVQEEDAQTDADPVTSEGLFVYNNGAGPGVNVGDIVRVQGDVSEYYELTELNNVTNIAVCSSGNALTASALQLPFPSADYLERYEGMSVVVSQTLYVTENYTLGRGGEVWVSSGDRLMNPTTVAAPGAAALAVQAANDLNRLLVDDGQLIQNPDPVIYPAPGLSASNTLRSGYTVDRLEGVITYSWSGWSGTDNYRLHPTVDPTFIPTNPQPGLPEAVGGRLRVAYLNVLNYFNGDGVGGGFPTARGAETPEEFTRQRAKTISAISGIDADVLGLMEIENDGYNAQSAIQDLVNGLNSALGAGTYAFIDPGVPVIGGDQIAVALIYQPAAVVPVGAAAILDSTVNPEFLDTKNRPVLAQTFEEVATGARFTVAVNHLKSKGSDCLDVSDPDVGDGQGNCNVTRTRAANALAEWLASDPTGSGDPDFLIIGDLNSYAKEDPIVALESHGYVNLVNQFGGASAYSYVFDGQSGYLDHALANPSLFSQVTGEAIWHINADEPIELDYNTNYKSAGQILSMYAPDQYRASDHDPAIIGLDLTQSVYGWLFIDDDGDGWRQSTETSGLAGMTIQLEQNGLPIESATTVDPGGWYQFSGVVPGSYCLTVQLPPTFVTTSPTHVCFEVHADDVGVNFGVQQAPLGSIGDLVWADDDADGMQDATEAGIAGVTVALHSDDAGAPGSVLATATTDAAGAYLFSQLLPGSYFVEVTDDNSVLVDLNLTVGPQSRSNPYGPISIGYGDSLTDVDFGYAFVCGGGYATIGDRVWNDLNGDGVQDPEEPGIADVEVCAAPMGYTNIRCATTNVEGVYRICVPKHTYLVAPVSEPAGMALTTASFYIPVVVQAGETILDFDFGYWTPGS